MAVAPGKFFEVPIQIDDDSVPIRIVRFDVDGNLAFRRDFAMAERIRKREELRINRARRANESDDEVIARLDLDDPPEDLTRREQQEAADELFAKRFVQETFEHYVSLKPGALTDGDGNDITSGSEFLRRYAGRADVIANVISQVFLQNVLSADLKKKLLSLSASAHSSSGNNAPSQIANGDTPAPTAIDASSEASAPPAAVTA